MKNKYSEKIITNEWLRLFKDKSNTIENIKFSDFYYNYNFLRFLNSFVLGKLGFSLLWIEEFIRVKIVK